MQITVYTSAYSTFRSLAQVVIKIKRKSDNMAGEKTDGQCIKPSAGNQLSERTGRTYRFL